jgi:glutamate--cysteine ligase
MADTLPSPWWQVPVAVMATLAYDPEAAERAAFAVRGTAGLWADAARYGLEQPDLARAARACFRAAVDAFPRMGLGGGVADVASAYVERYVERARCPADDRLDAWAATGATLVADHEMVA